jgi:uncharacterized protein
MTSPTERNRLAESSSPYLIQHKDNPVHWQPWDAAALAAAKELNRPILLSIGYATCHWCHVMARECFENPRIAAQMNADFVCIKVDREQRPDLDAIYQGAVQALAGHGGWPLTVFLTPDLEPFYAGTYFPPTDRHGLPALPRLLAALAHAWGTSQHEIRHNADKLTDAIRSRHVAEPASELPPPEPVGSLAMWMHEYDADHGGFGPVPKFPQPPVLTMMLDLALLTGRNKALDAVHHTLAAMAAGGIFDHIGGGFHRYSVDAEWLVPHFEKMLYDNAQMLGLYARAQVNRPHPAYLRVIRDTVSWLQAEMRDMETGLFYAAQDADADHREGLFHTWTLDELKEALPPVDLELFVQSFGISEQGNFEGRNIPHRRLGEEPGPDEERLAAIRQTLNAVRGQRTRPQTDTKILTDWNALTIAGLAEAGRRLAMPEWLAMAADNAETLLATMVDAEGRVLHCQHQGRLESERFASDAAELAWALLMLHQATGEERWLAEAVRIADRLFADFMLEGGALAMTPAADTVPLQRPVPVFDNVAPSANGTAARLCVALYGLSSEERWRGYVEGICLALASHLAHAPGSVPMLTLARLALATGTPHLQLRDDADGEMARIFWSGLYPLLTLAYPDSGPAGATLCAGTTCQPPLTDTAALLAALAGLRDTLISTFVKAGPVRIG